MCYMPAEIGDKSMAEFRGFLPKKSSKNKGYFIINELYSSQRIRIFTGADATLSKEKKLEIRNDVAFSIKRIDKKFYTENILTRLNIRGKAIDDYYSNLEKSFDNYKNLDCKYIQELRDLIINNEGIYFVMELLDFSLSDYAESIREPLKGSKDPIELKFRELISHLLSGLCEIHKLGLSLCALLNSDEIYIKEMGSSNEKGNISVTFPHPLLSQILTFIALCPEEGDFPVFMPPEIYHQLKESQKNEKRYKNLSEHFVNWEKVTPLLDQNFDKWAFGCLLYNLLYNEHPFKFKNLEEAVGKFGKNETKYNVYPFKISELCLKIIDGCLKTKPQDRIQDVQLNRFKEDIKLENSDKEKLEKDLKERIEKSYKGKIDAILFSTGYKGSQLYLLD